ncbi:hypothetical protein EJB05_00401, partial [Eragrostis curvula]
VEDATAPPTVTTTELRGRDDRVSRQSDGALKHIGAQTNSSVFHFEEDYCRRGKNALCILHSGVAIAKFMSLF